MCAIHFLFMRSITLFSTLSGFNLIFVSLSTILPAELTRSTKELAWSLYMLARLCLAKPIKKPKRPSSFSCSRVFHTGANCTCEIFSCHRTFFWPMQNSGSAQTNKKINKKKSPPAVAGVLREGNTPGGLVDFINIYFLPRWYYPDTPRQKGARVVYDSTILSLSRYAPAKGRTSRVR